MTKDNESNMLDQRNPALFIMEVQDGKTLSEVTMLHMHQVGGEQKGMRSEM